VRDHGLHIRPDLVPDTTPSTWEEAKAEKAALIEELRQAGYTVNGLRTVWGLYVIELSDDIGDRTDPDLPWVYVGQTTLTPEERFEQHRSGARNGKGRRLHSKWPHRYGIRLRPDLYQRESVRYSKDDALAAEAALAERLEREGYSVKGGH
jgi:predicted ATPase